MRKLGGKIVVEIDKEAGLEEGNEARVKTGTNQNPRAGQRAREDLALEKL